MALSRMKNLGQICLQKHTALLKPKNDPFKMRCNYFKRNRSQNLETAPPFANVPANSNQIGINSLLKPFGFTIVFSVGCFGGAVIWQYENMRSHAINMMKQPVFGTFGFMQKQGKLRVEFNKWWNQLSKGEKVFIPICFLNVLVFAAWRVPRFQPTMLKYFCSNPASSSVCLPMLLSTFSHYSLFHLLANMYVLHSFSSGAVATLGQEQFLALYLSAGVLSSFTSYVYKTITKRPGLSLGASGAIMAILGFICTQYPDTKLGIILVPFFTFSAGTAIKFIVGLDTAGVIMGWKFFDHAAHLGGAATGIAWALWGNEYIWKKRDPLLQYWHDLRGAVK